MSDKWPEINSYLHNGFSNVQKWFLYKFPNTMDFPSSYDKILWLIILQHQPHSLERERGKSKLKLHPAATWEIQWYQKHAIEGRQCGTEG